MSALGKEFGRFVRDELARHRWIVPGVAITGSAAFGSALTDIIAFARAVLS